MNEIAKLLNLPEEDYPSKEIIEVKGEIVEDKTQAAQEDFGKARKSLSAIIDVGQGAIGNLSELAIQSQDPEHYDALSKMIKELGDTSIKLMEAHEKIEKIVSKQKSVTKEINNNLFVGSTREVAALLKHMKED